MVQTVLKQDSQRVQGQKLLTGAETKMEPENTLWNDSRGSCEYVGIATWKVRDMRYGFGKVSHRSLPRYIRR